jgi:hypothetical protein
MDARRDTAQPAPGFEPPVEPGHGGSLRSLALVARIMRGRERAADAAGIPPLDSDQVLDLQRTAGNMLTAGALARWTDPTQQGLLDRLLLARASDPALHATICSALDALDLQLLVRVRCTDGPAAQVEVAIRGPAGGAPFGAVTLEPGRSATAELPFSVAFGQAASIAPGHGLAVALSAPDGSAATAILLLPFAEPATLSLGRSRYEALAEPS